MKRECHIGAARNNVMLSILAQVMTRQCRSCCPMKSVRALKERNTVRWPPTDQWLGRLVNLSSSNTRLQCYLPSCRLI